MKNAHNKPEEKIQDKSGEKIRKSTQSKSLQRFKIKCVRTGVFGVNTLVLPVYENAVLIVDPACSKKTGDDKAFVDFLRKNSLVPCGVFLTHGHFDHIAGTRILKDEFPFARLSVHEKDSFMIGENALVIQSGILDSMGIGAFSETLENLPCADVFAKDSENLSSVFGTGNLAADKDFSELYKGSFPELKDALSEWNVIHTPGHTKGSVCIYNEKKKVLVSGDTVFYLSYGRTDLPGGSDEEMRQSLNRLKENVSPDSLVFPGHDKSGFPFKENFLIF